jgi:hypothetical protein
MAFDPLVPGLPGAADIQVVDSLEACLQAADLIVVATPDPLFAGIDGASLVGRERPLTVVDCWRHARGLSRVAGVTYVAAGRAS